MNGFESVSNNTIIKGMMTDKEIREATEILDKCIESNFKFNRVPTLKM